MRNQDEPAGHTTGEGEGGDGGALVADREAVGALAAALAEPNVTVTAEYGEDAFLPR